MRQFTIMTLVFGVCVIGVTAWAASGLPQLNSDQAWLDHMKSDCAEGQIIKHAVLVMVEYTDATTIGQSPSIAATLNLDGTWSIDPLILVNYAWHSTITDTFGWRLLLAIPMLHLASFAHANYVNSHVCQKDF